MINSRSRRCFMSVLATLVAFACVLQAAPDPILQRVFSPYWTVASGYESTVQLHNNLVNKSLVVRPVLLSPSGDRTELPQVPLGPLENASLDLRQALVNQAAANFVWGSAVFEYMNPYGGALLAETTVAQPAKTLSYTIIGSEEGAKSDRLFGVYWFPPGKAAEIYVSLQNTSDQAIHVSAQLGLESATPFDSVTLGPREAKLIATEVPADKTGQSKERWGSVVLTHDAPEGALNTSGWIEMEDTGYSNMMTLYDPGRHKGNKLYGTQVFLKDVLVGGQKLKITSYLTLLNTADVSISPTAELAYESNGQVQRLQLQIGAISPHQTTQVDFDDSSLPADVSTGALTLNYDGPEGAVVGRVFGVADKTFGFYTTLETYTPATVNEIFWTTTGDSVSLLTVTNFGEKPDKVSVVLTYHGGTAALPEIELLPLQSATINVQDLKASGALPPTADYGGFRIYGNSRTSSKLLVKEHVISQSAQISQPFYGGSPYAVSSDMYPSSLNLSVGVSDNTEQIINYSDNSYAIDEGGTAGSYDTSVATVGTQSASWWPVTGQGPGSVTIWAWSGLSYPTDPYGQYYSQFSAGMQAVVCDFTVTPSIGNFSSNYCQNSQMQDSLFGATVSPSLSQCLVTTSSSSCSASNAQGDITLDATPQTCNIFTYSVTGHARYYGPSQASNPGGSILVGFTLVLNGRSVSHSRQVGVQCP